MNRRRNKTTEADLRIVLDAAATAYGPAVRGDVLDRMDPRFDTLGHAFTVPNLPAAEGDGEPMTAVEAFTVIDENGDSRTIQRGDRFGSEHPIVADHPSNFVRFNIPKVEQRDCAVWTNPQ